MSGLEMVGFLLGTTGPIEQAINITLWLHTHLQNVNQNANIITSLNDLFSKNRHQLEQLQLQINKCQPHLSQQALDAFNNIMSQVKNNIENACQSLNDMKITAKKKDVKHFLKAANIAADCEELSQLLQKTNDSLVQLNGFISGIETTISETHALSQKIETLFVSLEKNLNIRMPQTIASSSNDVFKPQFQRQYYSHAARPIFQTDNPSHPITIEAQIKQRLLTPNQTRHAILAIQGEAGVGKTTTLHMLSFEQEIRRHFVDGIYYMSLGADASTNAAIQQLRGIVRASGGANVCKDGEKWNSITQAIGETSEWLRDRTFLLLVDDVWDKAGVKKILQDIVSQIVIATPSAAAVFTTRDSTVATVEMTEKVFPLRKLHPTSTESRKMLLRHARVPENSIFEKKAEEAIDDILVRTAGLPVAHSVAGKAVAEYGLGCNSGSRMSAWVWYVDMNKSIIKSCGDKYSSLDVIFSTAIRTLEPKNNQSPSAMLRQLSNEDYMRMHRSLCVFEKQQWILIAVLIRLWGLDESIVRSVCDEFVKIGLAERHDEQFEDEIAVEGIMIHDLLHDFATEEAERHETVEKWHEHLVTEYSKEAGVEENEKCYSWWKLKDTDHGYVMKNLFRHLLRSECTDRHMKYVVSRPQWIASQLVANGIIQYEKDVWLATEQNENKNDLSDLSDMSNVLVKKLLDASRLSVWYICNNPGEVWFQLYGRLMNTKESSCLKAYLQYIEKNAPRPWLKPVSECLTGADGVVQQLIDVHGYISCTSIVPGKDEIVCGLKDGSIAVVDVEHSQIRRKWKAHEKDVSAICVSPSGRLIVSGCEDSTLKLWDFESRKQTGTVSLGDSGSIRSVAVSRDEGTVYTGSYDGSVVSWNADTLDQISVLLRPLTNINCFHCQLGVLEDENLIVYNGGHAEVMKISISIPRENKREKGLKRILRRVRNHLPRVGKSPNGKEVAHEARFESPCEVTTLEKEEFCFGLSGDGTTLVTPNKENDLNIWNGRNMMKVGKIGKTGDEVWRLALDSNTKRIATLDHFGNITVYEGKDDREGTYQTVSAWNSQSRNPHSRVNEESGLHFIGDGEQVVVCMRSGSIRVFDVRKATDEQAQKTGKMSAVCSAAATPNGQFFATGHRSGEINMWDTRSGKLNSNFRPVHEGSVERIAISENGEWLVSLSEDEMVAVWNIQTRNLKNAFNTKNFRRYICYNGKLDVNCDGTYVVLQTYDGVIRLWDTGNTEHPLLFIPQEKRTTDRLWNTEHPLLVTPQEKITTDRFWSKVWFRNGGLSIVAVSDDCIEEWDTSNGSCVQSRKFTGYHPYISREDIFNILSNPERQHINEPHGLFSCDNEIRYGRENSYSVLATFEARVYVISYSVKSQTLGIQNRGHFQMFHLHEETENTRQTVSNN